MMRFRRPLVLLLCFWLFGCYTLDSLRMDNRRNIKKITVGMTKQQVLDMMGYDYAEEGALRVNNPYSAETMWGENKTLDVYYYYTDIERADTAITSIELTPLVFEDGLLVGWGWDYLQGSIDKYKLNVSHIQS